MARLKARRGAARPARVRIIGGRLRGSVLAVPEQSGLRPTPNRLRETLFNWLQPHVAGARCLDLFAGSGVLGIEALSRGAGFASLVERDAGLARAIEDSLQRLGQTGHAEVHHADAMRLLATEPASTFDIVFVDPPFADALWEQALAHLEAGAWLVPRAWIYVEAPVETRCAVPSDWTLQREARAGAVRGALYRRQGVPVR